VITSGEANPSRESRDHAVWKEKGLLTVTGGKLTTFRLMVADVLKEGVTREPQRSRPLRLLNPVESNEASLQQVGETIRRRLLGRHGADTPLLINMARPGELETIPGTQTLWIELRWAAHAEGVVHLDDFYLCYVEYGWVSCFLMEEERIYLPFARSVKRSLAGVTNGGNRKRRPTWR